MKEEVKEKGAKDRWVKHSLISNVGGWIHDFYRTKAQDSDSPLPSLLGCWGLEVGSGVLASQSWVKCIY